MAALVAVATLIGTETAQAQVPIRPGVVYRQNPNLGINPYLAAYGNNLAALGRAYGSFYRSIPPYALGYNPYPTALNFGPAYNVPYTTPSMNPYTAGGYGAGMGAATLTSNPYANSPGMLDSSGSGTGSPYYSNPYTSYYDPFGGYFRGVADLTSAYGKYQIDVNRARLLNQEVERSKIETRRKIFDEWRYERMNMPTAEDVRQKNREIDLTRARRDPPLAEVLTGSTMNTLLSHLKEAHGKNQRGQSLPIDEDLLKKINVTSGHGGNIGLLKPLASNGKLTWPLSLRTSEFDKLRRQTEFDAEDAVSRAKTNGEVDAALMTRLLDDAKQLHKKLEDSVGDLTPTQYIEGKRFLHLLDDALRALQDPNVNNYFNRKYEARGKTVGDLVDYMNKEGLSFAGAMPGDEAAYKAVQNLLGAYDDNLTRLASNK